MAITQREYERIIERLEGCRASGWTDLWLAGAGAGMGLLAAALVTVLSIGTSAPSGTHDILWMLAILGGVITALSLTAYFSQRHQQGKEITELKTDMKPHASAQGVSRQGA